MACLLRAFIIQELKNRSGPMKDYEELELEIIVFDAEDVIVTSGEGNEEETSRPTAYELPFIPAGQL